jgi:hypothetical protein
MTPMQVKTFFIFKWMIEVGNIEYGNIENFCGLLNRKLSDGNIEFNFENGNIDSKTGSNRVKRGHSIPYHHQRSPPHPPTPRGTPFDPLFDPVLLLMLPFSKLNSMLPFSKLNLSKSMLTFFDVTHFSQMDYYLLSKFV